MALEIKLYAEFLLNIRSIAIHVTLRNKNKHDATVRLSSDRNNISLTYDHQTTSIALPFSLQVERSAELPVRSDPCHLSLRWEILDNKGDSDGSHYKEDSDPLWSASSLNSETSIACKDCRSIIVANAPRVWKDLPRGSWSETLDQWYCHRPQVKGVIQKDYSGSKGPKLEKGIAFVETCHFVLIPQDCQSVKVEGVELVCSKCSGSLGVIDDQLDAYRLYKWSLQLNQIGSGLWKGNDLQNFICAQMLELMEDQNARKFLAYTGKLSEAHHGLLLWAFNPDIKYSSSQVDQGRPHSAMKLLYKKVNNPKVIADKMQLNVEDLILPAGVLRQLETDLDTSHENLPENAKKALPAAAMGSWKVALLDRFNG